MPSGSRGLLSWTVHRSSGVSTVVVEGEIDLSVVDALRAAMEQAISQDANVVVDLGGVTFLDSLGLRLLLEAKRSAEARGGAFSVGSTSAAVERVFEVTGVGSFFEAGGPAVAPKAAATG